MHLHTNVVMNLSDKEMQLLALVAFDELPGREVAKRYKDETRHNISYGTLYTTFRRLKDEKLVTVRDDEDDDGRIRYFQITADGRRALNHARQRYQQMAGFGLLWGGAS